MSKFFNPETLGWLDSSLRTSYESAGVWPDKAVEVTDEVYQSFREHAPAGKRLGALKGQPAWVDHARSADEVRADAVVRLAEIDRLSVRALRAFAAGTATSVDKERLAQYDKEADALRLALSE